MVYKLYFKKGVYLKKKKPDKGRAKWMTRKSMYRARKPCN